MADQHDDRRDAAAGAPPPDVRPSTCPFLGLADDPSSRFDFPSSEHRCLAATPVYIELAHQGTWCLTGRYVSCSRYSGPDATAGDPDAGSPGLAPGPDAAAGADAAGGPDAAAEAGQRPPARTSYSLAARGGFGALASTPRGWVPVETSASPVAPAPVARAEAPAPVAPAEAPAPVAPAEAPAPDGGDPEGLGALVAGGAAAAGALAGLAAPDTTAEAPPGPIGGETALATAVAAVPAELPVASGTLESEALPVAAGPFDDAPAPEAPRQPEAADLPGPTPTEGPGLAARLAALGRALLRGVAILAAGVLVLAALVGVGYVAGKVLVRPGEALPSVAPSAAVATPATSAAAPGPTSTAVPGAGGASPAGSAAPSAPAVATPRPTPTPEPTPRPTPKPRVYVVKSGDTLFAIAERFGVTVEAIIEANDIANPNAIIPGQRLTIPRP